MNKPTLVFQAPIFTRSGYGDHSRDLLQSLFELDKYDIKIIPTRWGNTPQNQIDANTPFGNRVFQSVITNIEKQPDVYIQVTVANEFQNIGKYNIGVTAGVESTIAPIEFIHGCNKMDLVLVPSKFTKEILEKTTFTEVDKRTGQKLRDIRIEKPIEVLFEGVDLNIFDKYQPENDALAHVKEDFSFLFVGHWLSGDLGHDRKDVGMLLKTFCTIFKSLPKDKQPGLILKTSMAGFSVGDREMIADKIKFITKEFGEDCPSVYLLFGDMSAEDLSNLYHNPKVKAMVSFTKGEGYGRPLAEFAVTGKPVLVSDWSGHKDFLPKENTVYLEGELTPIHPSSQNAFLLKEASWFQVDYTKAAQKLFDVYKNYSKNLEKSKGLSKNIKTNFSLSKMTEEFGKLLNKYVKVVQHVELKLPKITKQ